MIFDTSGEPIRHNQSEPNDLTWGENYFGVETNDINFPWFRAALTGIEPFYRDKVMSLK